MIFFILLIVSTSAFDKNVLKSGLQSNAGQVKLFSTWMKAEHKDFDSKERTYRFRIFRKHLKEIVQTNDEQDLFELDANFMAGLTEQEQQKWYGINTTAVQLSDDEPLPLGLQTASAINWRMRGKVTPVKNQGGCGSCWTFAGVGSFEGHYAIKTGGLKTFSEQEMLDCTYEDIHGKDGCGGGWYSNAYYKIIESQHLALSKDYPYKGEDGLCRTRYTPNGMTAASLKSVVEPRKSRGDGSLVTALNVGPVAMAFEIKGGFDYYKRGILSVYNCGNKADHAMTVTGYASTFFEIKNSWGSRWGDDGYVKFNRRIENMCGISNWIAYPELKRTGSDANDIDITPTEAHKEEDPDCKDHLPKHCPSWAAQDYCNIKASYMAAVCKKSCHFCECVDGADICAKWAASGFCTSTYGMNFMKLRCRKTCGYC